MNGQNISEVMPFNFTRLVLLGLTSILLCVSFLMSIFTPFPIALAAILYGRKKGYGIGIAAWFVCLVLTSNVFGDLTLFAFYSMALFIAIAISEITLRKMPPLKGLFTFGGSIIGLAVILIGASITVGNINLKSALVEEINKSKKMLEVQKEKIQQSENNSKEAFEVVALLSQPKLLADEILKQAPSYFFMGTFLILWANLFLLLRSNRILKKWTKSDVSEVDLLNIKIPDNFIFLVIAGLVLAVFGESLGTIYPVIGITILKCVGIFYFFQGFGIYLAFLDFVKFSGFFRTVLVMLTIFTASKLIALVGLFDMFVNFRRFFKKENNLGER